MLEPKAELARNELLVPLTDSRTHVLSGDQKRSPFSVHSTDQNVCVRVRRVVMIDRDPLQTTPKVPLDAIDELSCMRAQIKLLPLLWRHDYLPKPWIFLTLPAVQLLPQVHLVAFGVEPKPTLLGLLCPLPRQAAAVCIPGAAPAVPRIGDLDDAALKEPGGKVEVRSGSSGSAGASCCS